MSKLLDKLEKSQKDYGGKLGFNKNTNENIYPQILIVGKYSSYSFKSKESEQLVSLMDGIVFQSNLPNQVKDTLSSLPAYITSLPWGVWPPSLKATDVTYLKKNNCDFIVSDIANTPLEALHESTTARILQIPNTLDERILRSLDDLPVDGFLLQLSSKLAVKPLETLLEITTLRSMVSKYLFVEFLTAPTEKYVDILKEVGIDVLIVDPTAVTSKQLTTLRTALIDLPKRVGRGSKSAATVSQLSSLDHGIDYDDDDFEYD